MSEILKRESQNFTRIMQEIKSDYLSNTCMPKLVLGTGLSLSYQIPGMWELFEELDKSFETCEDQQVREMWNLRKTKIESGGLEFGLTDIIPSEEVLVDKIKQYTSEFILNSEIELMNNIYDSKKGFYRLLNYLKNTVSANYGVIDIMTPNYDRVIELVCDASDIGVINGFKGQIISKFNPNILKNPDQYYVLKHNCFVRLFKPHGSINWTKRNGEVILTNDNKELLNNINNIEIITPGGSKFKIGMINSIFRNMRETFNEVLSVQTPYSLFIFGYGFNDEHFDNVLLDNFNHNTLIVSKFVKSEIVNKAMENKKITIFYYDDKEEQNYLIYKQKGYKIDCSMWNIDEFANIFFS